MSKTTFAVSGKKYGWRDRRHAVSIYNVENSQPVYSIPKLLSCSNKNCSNVESKFGEFQHCTNCLTVYCCRECQKADWADHKSFCKSEEAYYSHLEAWQSTLSPDFLGDCLGNGPYYLKAWEEWTRSDKMKKVLQVIGRTEADVHPYKDGLYTDICSDASKDSK